MEWLFGSATLGVIGLAAWVWPQVQQRGLQNWLPEYWSTRALRADPCPGEPVHLLLCIADHFEPKLDNASPQQAQQRVDRWCQEYPECFAGFRDSDGFFPRHTFFYPAEEYEPAYLHQLADLCRKGFGEVEIHLHHDNDTAENLRHTLLSFKKKLREQHGLLSIHRHSNEVGYAFIHGNWALDNSHPAGRWCGINNELDILRETGCFTDMTMPTAPSPTQTTTINSIYYACDDPQRPKSHDRGYRVDTCNRPEKSLLLIQGPLLLDWSRRKWGLLPRIENACLQGNQIPTAQRLKLWLRACIQVPQRPDWYFVKLHTHGANEKNMPVLLGEPMRAFHQMLRQRLEDDRNFHYHYVTAREMANLVFAAEAGFQGTVAEARDYCWLRGD
ncbi:MAG TPA: hypothetical protein PKD72_00340 [Gemmatales bacterium]|nr:hypothetical protein [Gemmatales bacterium]